MKRRDFVGGLIAGAAMAEVASPLALGAENPSAISNTWLGNEPLVFVGNWDSMPIFRRRVGGNPTWQEAEYREELSEDTVRRLKALGVTLAILHFYKGFGLQAEEEHIADARKLAALLRQYGIKVGLYVGSTIAYETFLVEKPEAEEWFVPDYLGQPVFYFDQTFRKRVYFMHPGYREYMKRVIRIGVEDLKADNIDFDNTSLQAQPAIFQHPLAIEDFRKYLTSTHTPEQLKKRFGFSNMSYVTPPKYGRALTMINDPLFQEWANFRCHQLNAYYAEMNGFIHSLNPKVVISTNPHSGISGRNTIWDQGVYYPNLLPQMDLAWTEEGDAAGVTDAGILVSKIRTYKMANLLNKRILTYTAGRAGGSKLAMGESLAFNRQSIGMVGGMLTYRDMPADQKKYIDFFHRHFDHYRQVKDRPDVAILYSYATMAFNNERPAVSFMLFSQVLIQANIPFTVIFDEQLSDLSKYRVLVLADQECLNEDKLKLIRQFVQNGGGLVATEHTSLYTEWRQRRRDFGLKDLFGVAPPPWHGASVPEPVLDIKPVRNQIEKGRVTYLGQVQPSIEKPAAASMTSQYWKMPVNWRELVDAVEWAANGKLSLRVNLPTTSNVVAEIVEQKEQDKVLLHLLNYDAAKTPVVKGIGIDMELPAGKRASQVTVLTPDGDGEAAIPFSASAERIKFTVPQLATYSVSIIQLA